MRSPAPQPTSDVKTRHARLLALGLALGLTLGAAARAQPVYVAVPGATFRSVLPPDGRDAPAEVAPFALRRWPVSNAEFLRFVQGHPQWQRGQVPALLADEGYLSQWRGPLQVDAAQLQQPVTRVSWFAARAYCADEQARLPRWAEWELVAAADAQRRDARDDPAWRERLLAWYSEASALPDVGQGPLNAYGVGQMHAAVWEWVEDFAGFMVSADNREQGDPDRLKFCGAGALTFKDRDDYAMLMRLAMLSSLKARYTTANLGFRCAR